MTATLTFNLPEEEVEHKYALAGTDALLVIHDLDNEIREYLRHNQGELKQCEDWEGNKKECCPYTMQKVRDFILQLKTERNLPELI